VTPDEMVGQQDKAKGLEDPIVQQKAFSHPDQRTPEMYRNNPIGRLSFSFVSQNKTKLRWRTPLFFVNQEK
jgi:hypothetical protein